MTKIVRASLGLPTLRAGPQFPNSKPVFCFGHWILEFDILQCSTAPEFQQNRESEQGSHAVLYGPDFIESSQS
jgi:hypothetical protein